MKIEATPDGDLEISSESRGEYHQLRALLWSLDRALIRFREKASDHQNQTIVISCQHLPPVKLGL